MQNNLLFNAKGGIRLRVAFSLAIFFTVIAITVILTHFHTFKKYPQKLVLTKDAEIQGINFSAGTIIYFNNKSISRVISSNPLVIQDIKCQKNVDLGFYPSGKMQYACALAEDQEIQGMPCNKDIEVSLYESGRLHTAGLSEGRKFQDIFFPARSELFFYESGKLEGARLSRLSIPSYDIQGILCDTRYEIYFHESGNLMSATLSQDQEIGGKFYKNGKRLEFDKTGKVIELPTK